MSPMRPDLVDCWMFRVVHSAREQQPLPTTESTDERMLERTGIRLVAGNGPAGPPDDPLALRYAPHERLAVRAGRTGYPGDDRAGNGRPQARRGLRGSQAHAGARIGDMAGRLGDVPVGLPARRGEQIVRHPAHHLRQGVGERRELRDRPFGRPGPRSHPNLALDRDETTFLDPAPCGDDVRRTVVERVDPGVSRDRHR